MKFRKYYESLTELFDNNPEAMGNDQYVSDLMNGQSVTIGEKKFAQNLDKKSERYRWYYVESFHPYTFDESQFNIYDDLISDEIRQFIPNHVIRSIRNAKSDFKKRDGSYIVEFEYLPLQHKRVSDSQIFSDRIITVEFKIGDWLIVKNNEFVFDMKVGNLTKKYGADFQSFTVVGRYLSYNWLYVEEAHRNHRSTYNEILRILKELREDLSIKLRFAKPDDPQLFRPDELTDQIDLINELIKLPIVTQFRTSLDDWRTGAIDIDTKADTKYFIDLVNNQNIRRKLAESMIKNPFSKFEKGGNIAMQNFHMAMSDANTIAHHSKELIKAVTESNEIPAWVVAKLHQASTTLSDITHYLEGTAHIKFEDGGNVPDLVLNVGDRLKMKYSEEPYQLVSLTPSAYTVAKVKDGQLEEYNTYPYNFVQHGLFSKA